MTEKMKMENLYSKKQSEDLIAEGLRNSNDFLSIISEPEKLMKISSDLLFIKKQISKELL